MKKSIITVMLAGLIAFLSISVQAQSTTDSLYKRLGGYAAISAVVDDLVDRLMNDKQLGRFYAHRGMDGIAREKQFTKDFISAKTGGPLYYTGRNMKLAHVGMRLSKSDWQILLGLLDKTLNKFNVPAEEKKEVMALIDSLRDVIVEL